MSQLSPDATDVSRAELPAVVEAPGARRRRFGVRRLAGRALRQARTGARDLLTPTPMDPDPPVPPPIVVTNDSRLLRYSPFGIGFFGALGVLVALGLAMAVVQVQSILVLVLMALFLALGLHPAVQFLTRRRIPRGLAVSIVTLTTLAVVGLGVVALVPIMTTQVQALSRNLPGLLENLTSDPRVAALDEDFQVVDRVAEFLSSGALLQTLFGGIWGAGRLLANLVFSLIMTLVLTIYFLASLPMIKETIYKLAPGSRRARARYLANEIFSGVSGYITGMFMIVTVAATCAFIYMNIVGLGQYSLALAFVVALFCFIPVVGSSLAMIAVAIVGFAVQPTLGIITIIYFLIYQQFDAYVIYPNVMKRTIKVPGALVILSAIIGGMLLGVIGALIAIPTAAALLLLYKEVLQPHLDAT